MSIFDIPVDRKGTDAVKWSGLPGADVIPMCIADMDFRAPEPIIAALQERVSHGVFGYTRKSDFLDEAIVSWVGRRYGWPIAAEWLGMNTGVVTSLCTAIRALTREGEQVIIQPPVYHPFFSVITNNNRVVVENPLLLADGKYQMDFDLLERQAAGAKLLILCNPHNPVGRVWTAEELTRLGEICLRHGVIVLSDDIHCDITFTRPYQPFAALREDFARQSVTCMSPSKTFNIAGLHTSYEIVPDALLREKMQREKTRGATGRPDLFGLIALETAYRCCDGWLDDLVRYLDESRRLIIDRIRRMNGVDIIVPEGTYLAWLDFRQLARSSAEINERLLRDAGVRLFSGRIFGVQGEGFLRMNFATPHAMLLTGLSRIENVISRGIA